MVVLRIGIIGNDQANAMDMVGPAEALACARRDQEKGKSERCHDVSIIGLTRRVCGRIRHRLSAEHHVGLSPRQFFPVLHKTFRFFAGPVCPF